MLKVERLVIGIAAFAYFGAPGAALADMGLPPIPQGTYVSFEGGYLYQDANGVIGHGLDQPGGGVVDVVLDPTNGYFVAGTIAFTGTQPLIGPFRRIEGYVLFGQAEDSVSDSSPPTAGITYKTVDGGIFVSGGATGHSSAERETWEGGLRFEFDDKQNATTWLTWSLVPFVRVADEDVATTVAECCLLHRTGDVETWLYGVVAAVEPQVWITPAVAVVGRLGVGIYGYNADGTFRSYSTGLPPPDPFAVRFSDSEDGVGFRGQLGTGLKFKITSATTLETFAEADYFSAMGVAHMADNQPTSGDVSHVDTDDMWELRAGARLNIGFGSGY